MKITITRKLCRTEAIAVAEDYVTNGHWLIHKECIKNVDTFANAETAAKARFRLRRLPSAPKDYGQACLRFFAARDNLVWTATEWIMQPRNTGFGLRSLRLLADNQGRKAWIDELYYQTFKCEHFYGAYSVESEGRYMNPLRARDCALILMPVAVSFADMPNFPGTVSAPVPSQSNARRLFDFSLT